MEDTNGGNIALLPKMSVSSFPNCWVTAKTEQEQEQEQEQEEGQTRDPMTIDCVDDGGNINTDTDDGAVTLLPGRNRKGELNESIQNDVITNMKKVPKNNNSADGNLTSIGNKNRVKPNRSRCCANALSVYIALDMKFDFARRVCSTLGVERRRIYDIVNVLEAVEIVVRKGKNKYACQRFQAS